MTVAALPSVAEYLEDGVTTSFPVPFRFKSPSDLAVERIFAGYALPLALGTDYAVTGGETDAGGTVNRTIAASGATLRIRRKTARRQPMVYTTGDRFPAVSHEEALDRQMLIAQEQDAANADTVSRALMVPPGEEAPVLPPAADRAGGNKILGPDPVTGVIKVLDGSLFKGDPGGYPLNIGLFVIAFTLFIPVGTDIVQTSGQIIKGLGFARYASDENVDAAYVAANSRTAFISKNGRGFRLAETVVDVTMCGALGDDVADDTPACQAALDTRLPVHLPIPLVAYKLTDELLLEPGAIFSGAGGTAQYGASPVKIRFAPLTKRGVFRWRNAPTDYVFGGTRIDGFCLTGTGPGASIVLDLPFLFNADINFFCYEGVDSWARLRRWQSSNLLGGVQGFRTHAVEFANIELDVPEEDLIASDVTTSTTIKAYIAHGPIAYYTTRRTVTDVKVTGVIESVDHALDGARGNVMWFDVYTENVPRTDAGDAWIFGKRGIAPAYETSLSVNLRPGFGVIGVPNIQNANAFSVDHVRLLSVTGAVFLYRSLLKTTVSTQRVTLFNLVSSSINLFSQEGGIADYAVITMAGFVPEFMKLTPSSTDLLNGANISATLRLWSQEELGMENDKFFLNSNTGNKFTYKDRYGNVTAPMGALRVAGTSNWTINGGTLSPGELVQNLNVTLGEPGLWVSSRHSKDVGNNYPGCTTIADSRVITHPTNGAFFKCEVGDYVTVSDGFGDGVVQRRVIDRSPDLTSITLDSVAISTVVASVVVATEAHKLLPLAQQGAREVEVNPTGMLTPNFRGEEVFRTDTFNFYKATGFTSGDWKLIT